MIRDPIETFKSEKGQTKTKNNKGSKMYFSQQKV